MKLYPAYKKLLNRARALDSYQSLKLWLVVIFLGILLFIPTFFSYAQTAQELQNKISQKDSDITKLEEEIKIYQAELTNIGQQKNSLSKSIQELDLTRKKLVADISITQKKIDKTNFKIQDFIANGVDSISAGIRNTNEFEQGSLLETLLSENDFSVIWNDIDNIATVREKIIEDVNKLKLIKGELEDTRAETIDAKNELVLLKSKLSDQQKIVIQNTNEKNKLLKETKNNEANYQKLLKEQIAKKLAFEKELRDYEAQLQFILDPSKLPSAGVLSWPLDKVFVTQEFGAKTGPHRTYTSGHSGTDFRARTPLPIYSMAEGIVKGDGDTDTSCSGVSFGKWIFIEYNNGLSSTFGHLSLIRVREGQKVSRGEVVGYTGGTGRVTGPHLHVSLYASGAVQISTVPSISCPGKILKQPIAAINAYLDPMYYLPPYIPSP